MKTAEVNYLGDLRTESRHLKSGNVILTDAPIDNHGKGAAFSPTDLTCTSLANCMITTMGIAAQNHSIQMQEVRAEVLKIMASEPRRIASIEVDVYMPNHGYTNKEKTILEHAAHTCPVAKSLHPELIQVIRFHWSE
ncbi:MAG: OsmC family protein [Saprospiraceae bacterium]